MWSGGSCGGSWAWQSEYLRRTAMVGSFHARQPYPFSRSHIFLLIELMNTSIIVSYIVPGLRYYTSINIQMPSSAHIPIHPSYVPIITRR